MIIKIKDSYKKILNEMAEYVTLEKDDLYLNHFTEDEKKSFYSDIAELAIKELYDRNYIRIKSKKWEKEKKNG